MSLFNWVLAGTVAALAAALPQSSEARFGPVGPVAQSAPQPLDTTGDGYAYGGGQVHKAGYYRRGYGYRRYGHRPYGYRGSSFSFSLGFGGPVWGGFGPGWGGYYYAPPPVVVYRPAPRVYYRSGGYEPWTPGWYRYCTSKYRTFNPRTGYYYYKVGRQRFCR